jgi:hypothetical protein
MWEEVAENTCKCHVTEVRAHKQMTRGEDSKRRTRVCKTDLRAKAVPVANCD